MLRRLRGFVSGEVDVACLFPAPTKLETEVRLALSEGRAHGPDLLLLHLSFPDFPISSGACGECRVHAEMSCGCWKSWTWGARPWLWWGVIRMVSAARRTRIQDPAPGHQSGTEMLGSRLHQGSQSPKAPESREVPASTADFCLPACEDTASGLELGV